MSILMSGYTGNRASSLPASQIVAKMESPEAFCKVNANSFKPTVDIVHGMGIKFGIHVMHDIRSQEVQANTPIMGGRVEKVTRFRWDHDAWGSTWVFLLIGIGVYVMAILLLKMVAMRRKRALPLSPIPAIHNLNEGGEVWVDA
eukprot:Gb_24606 [translate_table: standard]